MMYSTEPERALFFASEDLQEFTALIDVPEIPGGMKRGCQSLYSDGASETLMRIPVDFNMDRF